MHGNCRCYIVMIHSDEKVPHDKVVSVPALPKTKIFRLTNVENVFY